jgi:MFS family permease
MENFVYLAQGFALGILVPLAAIMLSEVLAKRNRRR